MYDPIHQKKKKSTETVLEETQILDVLDKDFKSAMLNVFK